MYKIAANRLPIPYGNGIGYSAVVAYENSFLLVGGYNGLFDGVGGEMADVYQYRAEEDGWVRMEGELKTARSNHVALLVSRALFPECK